MSLNVLNYYYKLINIKILKKINSILFIITIIKLIKK